jgi:hypothetical protein
MGVDKLSLLMKRPIAVNKELGIYVHQPTVNEIIDMGEDEYGSLVLPYILTTDFVFNGVENEEKLIKQFDMFDLFFLKVDEEKTILDNLFNGKKSLDVLSNSLSFFLKTNDIRILKNRMKIIVNNSYLIDKEEFKNLRNIIQAVTNRKDLEVEKPPKNMTKRQADIWRKLQQGRKRKAEKDAIYTQDMINFIAFGGKSYIPYEEIGKMTIYQMHNAYKSIIGIDAFNIGMQYKLSQKFDVKDDIKHWTETLKIGK